MSRQSVGSIGMLSVEERARERDTSQRPLDRDWNTVDEKRAECVCWLRVSISMARTNSPNHAHQNVSVPVPLHFSLARCMRAPDEELVKLGKSVSL